MTFQADTAFAMALIALGAGFWVIIKAKKEESGTRTLGTVLGYFILITGFLTLLCTTYYSVRYWEAGTFRAGSMPMMSSNMMYGNPNVYPYGMMGRGGMMMGPGMMGQGMMGYGNMMMPGMTGNGMTNQADSTQINSMMTPQSYQQMMNMMNGTPNTSNGQ